MGILHGLLSSSSSSSSTSTTLPDVVVHGLPLSNHNNNNNRTTPIRIAVLERGDFISSSSSSSSSSTSNSLSSASVSSMIDPCIRPLHRWCAASFPTYLNHYNTTTGNSNTNTTLNCQLHEGHLCNSSNSNNSCSSNHQTSISTSSTASSVSSSSSVIETSTTTTGSTTTVSKRDDWYEWYRILDISTGYGLGGTTLINAGLVIPPNIHLDFNTWPDTIAIPIASSISTITSMMYSQQCIHPSLCTATTTTSSSSSSSSSVPSLTSQLPQPNLIETTTTTSFPSCCLHVPCAVQSPNLQRVSYFESLVEPLLPPSSSSSSRPVKTTSNVGIPSTTSRFDITILTGYTVERLLMKHENDETNSATTTTTNTTATKINCTGVEVYHTTTNMYHTFTATKDVILCTGTIISPVLLLNAGIGRPSHNADDCNNNSNSIPTTPTATDSSKQTISKQSLESEKAAVGYKLHDHVLLPRAILTYPDLTKNALNGVRAITNRLLVLHHNNDDNTNNDRPIVSKNDDTKNGKNNVFTTKTQISLMDSAAYMDLVPIMGAAPFRYQLRRKMNDTNGTNIGNVQILILKMMNILLYLQYHVIQLLLHLLIRYTPLYYIAKYCIKVIAIFVMNGESHGTLTISPKIIDGRSNHSNNKTAMTGGRRIRDVNIHIQLGYLSNPNDLQRFRQAFVASIDAYNKNECTFRTICEIFPGPLIWNYTTNQTTTTTTSNNASETHTPIFHNERFDFMARSMVLPYFHWIGTCAMKQKKVTTTEHRFDSKKGNDDDDDDDDWVVDEYFRVRGVNHLRICDASIFPTLISAPTALTCAALGHILANMIIEEISKDDITKMKKRE